MKVILKNNSSDDFTYLNGTITVPSNGSVEVPSNQWFDLSSDSNFFKDIELNNVVVNDGIKDLVHPESEEYLSRIVQYDPKSKEITTQFEKNDKRLKLASGKVVFDANGDAEFSIKIPSGGRWVAGGNAFTDVFYAGDKTTFVKLVDVDNVMGYGANVTLAYYNDQDVAEEDSGWYFEPRSNGTGFIEINPIGGYGFLPEGTYLKMHFKKEPASQATQVFINVFWGKVE